MSRPGLLRRAAAATLGAGVRPAQTTVLTASVELGLARRAAAAVIGIRSYRPVDNPSSASRVWEVRRPTGAASRRSLLTAPPPRAEPGAATGPRPSHHDGLRPDPSDWLTVVLDPTTPATNGSSSTPAQQRQRGPRHALALAALAAVLAIAFTAFGYQLRPFIHQHFPSHPVHGDDPFPSASPSAVVSGDVPEEYLGSWRTTISNHDGKNTRSLVIQQGRIGDDVLILVADGSTGSDTYHCVFTAPLAAVSSGGGQLKLGPSAVTSGVPLSSCVPGSATTLTVGDGHILRRTNSDNGETLTYTR
ncbi:hypothetical protein OG806_49735 [Streptomyces sp. NBC_00882]|uniref:hypothetical protein n=1 Tax=Streptomyces sp. NBC_00882 TaxID=2975856 RepID=UPI00386C1194|nr:hypothetical protein OG806_00210 [Streptomyces sp. NBC_00882]WSZ36899.1 hypothetical protein OG806_49735 [Streptomyces sp. NBC_00882]